jgi:hypothetical protein
MVKNNLFVHIPRTGGTTVHVCLDAHVTVCTDHILGIDAKRKWPNHFRYTFMRNPYTRMVSLYECQFPRERNHYHLPNEDKDLTFERYVEIITNKEYDHHDDHFQHWRPQTDWIFDDDNRIIIDYIGHTETLDKDINEIGHLIGVGELIEPVVKKGFAPKPSYVEPFKFTPDDYSFHRNRSNWRYLGNYRYYFNDVTQKQVEKYYERDLDFLKVKF